MFADYWKKFRKISATFGICSAFHSHHRTSIQGHFGVIQTSSWTPDRRLKCSLSCDMWKWKKSDTMMTSGHSVIRWLLMRILGILEIIKNYISVTYKNLYENLTFSIRKFYFNLNHWYKKCLLVLPCCLNIINLSVLIIN